MASLPTDNLIRTAINPNPKPNPNLNPNPNPNPKDHTGIVIQSELETVVKEFLQEHPDGFKQEDEGRGKKAFEIVT